MALDRFPSPELLPTILEAAKKHKTKVLLCLGGNSRSGGFSTVATDQIVRSHFVNVITNFLIEHKLHGLDLNWEYPNTQQEWEGLFLMIQELNVAFKPYGLILSMAIYPGQERALISSPAAIASLDYIHTMSYDQNDRHSTKDFAKKTIDGCKQVLGTETTKKKVTLGVPFYGRRRTNGEAITYQELVNNNPAAAISSKNEYNGFYYNGVKMIKDKTTMASKRGLAGIMIWEVGQDITDPTSEDSLLQAIWSAIPKQNKKNEL